MTAGTESELKPNPVRSLELQGNLVSVKLTAYTILDSQHFMLQTRQQISHLSNVQELHNTWYIHCGTKLIPWNLDLR